MTAIRTLESTPPIHPECDEADLRPSELRQMLFGLGGRITHRVVYFTAGQTVRIVRIRHVARDGPHADD